MKEGFKINHGKVLEGLLSEKKIPKKRFAKMMDISASSITNMLSAEEISKANLCLICALLGVEPIEFGLKSNYFLSDFSSRHSFDFLCVDNASFGDSKYANFFTDYFNAFDTYIIKGCQHSLYVMDYLTGNMGLSFGQGINQKYRKGNRDYFRKMENKLLQMKEQKRKDFVYRRLVQLPYSFPQKKAYKPLDELKDWMDKQVQAINPAYLEQLREFEAEFLSKDIEGFTKKFYSRAVAEIIRTEVNMIFANGVEPFKDEFTQSIAYSCELLGQETFEHVLHCYVKFPEYFAIFFLPVPARLNNFYIIDNETILCEYPRINQESIPSVNQLFINKKRMEDDPAHLLIRTSLNEFKKLTRYNPLQPIKKSILQEDFIVASNLAFNYLKKGIVDLTIRYEFLCLKRREIEDPSSDLMKNIREIKASIYRKRDEFIFKTKNFSNKIEYLNNYKKGLY